MEKSQWPLSSIKQQGIYSRKRSTTTTFLENIFWHAISKLQWLCVWSSWSKHRDQTMSQVVAYTEKAVKNIGNLWNHLPKSGWVTFTRRLFTKGSNRIYFISWLLCNDQWWVIYRYLTIQVFWHWLIIQGMLHNFALHHHHYHHHRHINIIRLSS